MTEVAYDCYDLKNNNLCRFPNLLSDHKILLLDNNSINEVPHYIDKCASVYHLSLTNNCISNFNNLQQFSALTILSVPGNNIKKISGLFKLCKLTWLDLSRNHIEVIENLDANTNLRHLDLSENYINELGDITCLKKLKSLLLHGNKIRSVRNAPQTLPQSLEILSMASNFIGSYVELFNLLGFKNLAQFSIMNNPSFSNNEPSYRPFILVLLPNLFILDGTEITPDDRDLSKKLEKSNIFANLSDYSPNVADALLKKALCSSLNEFLKPITKQFVSASLVHSINKKEDYSSKSPVLSELELTNYNRCSDHMEFSEQKFISNNNVTIMGDSQVSNPYTLLESESVFIPYPVDLSEFSDLNELSVSMSENICHIPKIKPSVKLPVKRRSLIEDVAIISSSDSDDVDPHKLLQTLRASTKKFEKPLAKTQSVFCQYSNDQDVEDLKFNLSNLNDAFTRQKNLLDGEIKLRKLQSKVINFLLSEVENLKSIVIKSDESVSASNGLDTAIDKDSLNKSLEMLGETIRFSPDTVHQDNQKTDESDEMTTATNNLINKNEGLTIEDVTELDAVRQAAIEAINLSVGSMTSEEDED